MLIKVFEGTTAQEVEGAYEEWLVPLIDADYDIRVRQVSMTNNPYRVWNGGSDWGTHQMPSTIIMAVLYEFAN